ncbi:hypothetical protein LY76DRAFT_351537 [Colletotrichum caudatum]|nr:hypothetical protein LY76DRAFT_351537 [Colletotrichum caudatum]
MATPPATAFVGGCWPALPLRVPCLGTNRRRRRERPKRLFPLTRTRETFRADNVRAAEPRDRVFVVTVPTLQGDAGRTYPLLAGPQRSSRTASAKKMPERGRASMLLVLTNIVANKKKEAKRYVMEDPSPRDGIAWPPRSLLTKKNMFCLPCMASQLSKFLQTNDVARRHP